VCHTVCVIGLFGKHIRKGKLRNDKQTNIRDSFDLRPIYRLDGKRTSGEYLNMCAARKVGKYLSDIPLVQTRLQ
jgi:hypothetical protein